MKRALLVIFAAALFGGCRAHDDRDPIPPRPRESPSVQRQAATLDDFVADIQGAQTQQQEADAIRALREYERTNGLTYKIDTFRTADNVPVEDPSTARFPVRAQITIYRGREVVRTFNFVPHDNRNLALFGE